jgi:glycosyltransferase involved in cell wall biosynthesis
VQAADASVLPSRVDNLPNSALESLALGTPVIGANGASLDEIIEPGLNGELVEYGDTEQLAAAMQRVWRREGSWECGDIRLPKVFKDMQPKVAVQKLVRLAGFAGDGGVE